MKFINNLTCRPITPHRNCKHSEQNQKYCDKFHFSSLFVNLQCESVEAQKETDEKIVVILHSHLSTNSNFFLF